MVLDGNQQMEIGTTIVQLEGIPPLNQLKLLRFTLMGWILMLLIKRAMVLRRKISLKQVNLLILAMVLVGAVQ
jgi:hypothetical protein